MKNHNAFTLLEIILVVFIAGLLFSIVFFANSGRYLITDILRAETDAIVSELKSTQFSSMFGVAGADYTVHIESTSITTSPGNKITKLDGVTISNISLNGGGSDITFSHQFGEPSHFGTLTVLGPNGETRTITISQAGAISWSL